MKDTFDAVDFGDTIPAPTNIPFSSSPLPSQKNLYEKSLKRSFDLLFSLLLLPFIAPILAVLWIIASKDGPGLYFQNRIGKNGTIFRCYKFRTMILNADNVLSEICASDPEITKEWQANQKLKNDPRITRIGHFLRATSLDELPQIWNVIKGDMSLVGPRPFMENQDNIYRAAGGRLYYNFRPGITGIWQVEGRGSTSFTSRISYDNAYAKHLNFWTDMKLILKTVAVVINRTGQ